MKNNKLAILSRRMLTLTAVATLVACGGAEERMARAIERGQAFLAEEDFAKARVEFSNALQIDPNNAEVLYLTGQAAEGLADYRVAAQGYQAALQVDPNHVAAAVALARLYLLGGAPERALEQLQTALAVAPNDPDALTVRAAANAALGDRDAAFRDVERVVAEHPGHEQAVALLAGLYRNRGETERAVAIVSAALAEKPDSTDLRSIRAQLHLSVGSPELAEADLERNIELEPDEIGHRNRLVQFYVSTGRADQAEAVLRENVAREPDVLEHKILLVNFIRAQQSFDAAVAEMQGFIADAPRDTNLKLSLGELYTAGSDFDSAEAVYREVVTSAGITPPALQARNRLAARMLQSDRVEEARLLIDEVLAANPRDNDALLMRASLSLASQDFLAAITDLRSVVRDQPDAANAIVMLARAHVANDEPDLAIENYRRAVTVAPANNELRLELARYLNQRGDNEEAAQLLAAVVNDGTADLPTLELLFQLQLSSGNIGSAAETAERVITAQPGSPLGYYLRGQAYEAGGDAEAALTHYETSLEKSPRAAEPLQALVRLEVAGGRIEEAETRLMSVAAAYPDHAVARSLLAELQLRDGDFQLALENLDGAIATSPNWWVPYRTKAVVHQRLGDLEAARSIYEQGMQATRDTPALGMEYAAVLERLGEAEKAIEVYENLYAANPSSEVLANNYAMMLATYRSDAASVERAYEVVRALRNSQVPAFLDTYGYVRFRQGYLDEALSYLRRAASGLPENAVVQYHLGLALLESGASAEAREALVAAIELEQNFEGVDEARDLLASLD